MSSSRPQRASFTSREQTGLAVPHPRDREMVLHTLETRRQAARILIVDRDSMSSDLLATALTRDRDFSACGIEAADLLNCLADGKADAVVIGSDLNVGSTNGFHL